MDPYFHVHATFSPWYLNVEAETKTHQIRQHFQFPIDNLVNCCSSSATRFDLLCVYVDSNHSVQSPMTINMSSARLSFKEVVSSSLRTSFWESLRYCILKKELNMMLDGLLLWPPKSYQFVFLSKRTFVQSLPEILNFSRKGIQEQNDHETSRLWPVTKKLPNLSFYDFVSSS